MTHELKTWPEFYQAMIDGKKRFEVRKNDRDFKVCDVLNLNEFDPKKGESGRHTGRTTKTVVRYVLKSTIQKPVFGIAPGYCVMDIVLVDRAGLSQVTA